MGAWLSGRFLRPPSPSVLTLLPRLMPVSAVALPLLLWGKKKKKMNFFPCSRFAAFCEIPFAARENLRILSHFPAFKTREDQRIVISAQAASFLPRF